MIRDIIITALLIIAPVASAGALSKSDPKPRLYPNSYLAQVGEAKANEDIAECSTAAAGYVHNTSKAGQGAKRVVGGAAKGAIMGTVGGSIMGKTGRGAAAGSVMGATRSVAGTLKQRGSNNPAFQEYVNVCLEDKGYRVLNWS